MITLKEFLSSCEVEQEMDRMIFGLWVGDDDDNGYYLQLKVDYHLEPDYFEELEPKITDIEYFVDDLYITKSEVHKYLNLPDDDDIYALIFDKISSVLW